MTKPAAPNAEPLIRLRSGAAEIIISADIGDSPKILYIGSPLAAVSDDIIRRLGADQKALGAPDINVVPSLSLEAGLGVNAPSGLRAHRMGQDWAIKFQVSGVIRDAASAVRILCIDPQHKLDVSYTFAAMGETGCFSASTQLLNTGAGPLNLDWLAALVLPIPQDMEGFIGFSGRWAHEFQTEEFTLQSGGYVRENWAGRTSHESPPFLIAKGGNTSEQSGPCLGLHLAWSGNHCVRLDRHTTGRIYAQMGEIFFPGERRLTQGEGYNTPTLYLSFSDHGLNALAHSFHKVLIGHILDKRTQDKPRPVHYNTWEAVYFNHKLPKLQTLAKRAADVGAERFVLDDGWFGGRRDDTAGLGDWWVSSEAYPDGLKPLADYVRDLGMEFGIWFEPEMVNPDSDLFRAHPDWVLGVEGVETVPYRHQYILDLTRDDVRAYLFEKMDGIIRDLDIGYIKWDMNRDNSHPGGEGGRAVASQQVRAVYALIGKLRLAHPNLEIESCSSGGGRADFAILQHTDRIWTSDNNDALDRQRIQRGASHFFPLSVTGSHVGPKICHITGRVFDMRVRVASAIFGHMGIEADLSKESDGDIQILKAGVALYKRHRALLHSGDFYRFETPGYLTAGGVVSCDKSEALVSCVKTAHHEGILPDRLKFIGLDPALNYSVRLVWPTSSPSLSSPSIIDAADLYGKGITASGQVLKAYGLQLPLTFLDVGLIFQLKAELHG